ncbi:MAG: 5'/3'-nucleotidase SurE [Phycisphaeraceae bacterium]|nr:5'/3'-nucleotidase SurE [Phycisphaerae bacterium]MBX3392180.1 5'/3'-nucleotidase SurE [Phycisphaeraceae bacterium]HRJ50236.1 5'/3'-nucleotidase SurE [Phycisphaerales bacterium]
MRILLTNDDGLGAPGIIAMHAALIDQEGRFGGPIGDNRDTVTRSPRSVVYPVAPMTVQSATSHGVTFHTPLMTREMQVAPSMRGIAVDGRPADCVKVAISSLWPEQFGAGSRPDLLISGMNAGANCGVNVIYSGTVAAAIEAAFLGVPSIAVSLLLGGTSPDFTVAAGFARRTIEHLIRERLPRPHECLSINIPQTTGPGPMPPIRVCPMNTHGLVDRYERRLSPSGDAYYWATGHGLDFHATDADSDVDLLKSGHITVTPLKYDLTRHDDLDRWREVLRNRTDGSSPSHRPRPGKAERG